MALAFAAAGAAAEPRAPTAKWNVNFGDAQCIAHRDYGTSATPLRLVLKAPPVGDVMQVAVMRAASSSSPQQVDAIVTIGERRPLKTNLLMYTPKASKERIYLLNMSSADFATLRQAKTVSVRSEGLNETFALSEMEPLLKVVDECVADLRQVFNIGASGNDPVGLTSRANTNLAKFFSDADYPDVAVMKGQSGRVGFALLIGEDGRVADCTIVSTSGVPSLDSQACALLKSRAKFEPARDLEGKPAKDSVVGGIVWRMSSKGAVRR
ncbi:MAG TPA: energy transducer TonB [Allosphingosinicella sp.]|nr:energy transducer TonB [Allosphingosinicella sp.]